MARQARKVSSTSYYHVMVRGINKEHIFNTDKDKYIFIKYIEQQLEPNEIELVAWCLMSNHGHFVLKAELQNISRFIKIILIKFSAYYNNNYQRVGPVFGDRFKSEAIEDDTSLKQVVRYVHQNPVKALLVFNIEDYKFSSYSEYLYSEKLINLNQKKFYLDYFNNDINRFINFHKEDVINLNFIETKDDKNTLREFACRKIISNFCKENGIEKKQQLLKRPKLFNELLIMLVNETDFSYRKIASIVEVDFNYVYYVAKRRKNSQN